MPPRCERVLDIGCGEGMLTRALSDVADHVTGIDRDAASLALARDRDPALRIDYLLGDVLTLPLPVASFDAVVSVATLHHMDASTGLRRMAELLRPGGTLVVVGLARSRLPTDLPRDLAAVLAGRLYRLRHWRRHWEHPSPTVWPPPETYQSMRRLVAADLPGARFTRHLLWRFSVVWTKPETAAPADR